MPRINHPSRLFDVHRSLTCHLVGNCNFKVEFLFLSGKLEIVAEVFWIEAEKTRYLNSLYISDSTKHQTYVLLLQVDGVAMRCCPSFQ